MIEVGKSYRLYAKLAGSKRFSAIDWSTGALAPKLIYATIFHAATEHDREILEETLVDLHRDNPEISFEFRVVNC